MKDIKIFCSFDLNLQLKHEKQIELYVDCIPNTKKNDDLIRIVLLIEPIEILDLTNNAMMYMKRGYYDFLLTHNDFLIEHCPNSFLFEYGTSWIGDYEFTQKFFSVSALVGDKTAAPGHNLRHDLWLKQKEITIPTNFYLSGHSKKLLNPNNNPIIGNSKNPLFDSQYHICIENSKRKNWFTEKIIDCFQTKTIPIYWGCTNINDWFDDRGIITFDSLDDLILKINNIKLNNYTELQEIIEDNFQKSQKFVNFAERIKNKIQEII